MPSHGHRVAAGQSVANERRQYKEGRRGVVNALRGSLAQVIAAVMAGEIRSMADRNLRNVSAWEQRMYEALKPSVFFSVAEIVHPSVWCISQTGGNAGGRVEGSLSVGYWFWSECVWSLVFQYQEGIVRPRQRMLSRRGTSRGGVYA